MADLVQMILPMPRSLERGRRRRVWIHQGEGRAFGLMLLTLLVDTVDDDARPVLLVEMGSLAPRLLEVERPTWVPGFPGVALAPRALVRRPDGLCSLLLELRAEVDSATLDQVIG